MRKDLCLAGTIVPYKNKPILTMPQSNGYKSQELIAASRHQLQATYGNLQVLSDTGSQIRLAERPCVYTRAMPEIAISHRLPTNSVQVTRLDSQSLPVESYYGNAYTPARALPSTIGNDVDWGEVERFVTSSGIKQYAQENVMPFVQRRLKEEGISDNIAFIAAGNAIVANKDTIVDKVKQNPYVKQAVVDAKGGNVVGAVVNILASSEIEEASQEAAARFLVRSLNPFSDKKTGFGLSDLVGVFHGNPTSWGKLLVGTVGTMANEDTEHDRKYIKFKDPFKIRFRK